MRKAQKIEKFIKDENLEKKFINAINKLKAEQDFNSYNLTINIEDVIWIEKFKENKEKDFFTYRIELTNFLENNIKLNFFNSKDEYNTFVKKIAMVLYQIPAKRFYELIKNESSYNEILVRVWNYVFNYLFPKCLILNEDGVIYFELRG